MKKYKYNSLSHSLIQEPEMKEPAEDDFYTVGRANEYADVEDYFLDREFREYNEAYQKHLASLKSYNVPEEFWNVWKDGELVGEKDFTIENKWVHKTNSAEHFAIPVGEEKEKEDEVKELNIKTAEAWYMKHLETAIKLIQDALPYSTGNWGTRAKEFLDKHLDNLVECKEKEDQDELWNEVLDIINDVLAIERIYDVDIEILKQQFLISKK